MVELATVGAVLAAVVELSAVGEVLAWPSSAPRCWRPSVRPWRIPAAMFWQLWSAVELDSLHTGA